MNTEKGKNLCFCLYLSRRPVWLADPELVELYWKEEKGCLEIRVCAGEGPV